MTHNKHILLFWAASAEWLLKDRRYVLCNARSEPLNSSNL